MKTLILLRHAKSHRIDRGMDDFERPLSNTGIYQAEAMGELLSEKSLIPDAIYTSDAERASQTTDLVLDQLSSPCPVYEENNLYEAEVDLYLDMFKELSPSMSTVLFVGHNPVIEETASHLCGQAIHLSTCTAIVLTLPVTNWEDIDTARLEVEPKILRVEV